MLAKIVLLNDKWRSLFLHFKTLYSFIFNLFVTFNWCQTSFNQANDELREYCSVFSKFEQARKATHNYCWSFSWLTFQLAWFRCYRALSGNTGQGFLVMRLIISLFISASMAFTSLSLRNNFLVQLNCWAWLVVCELCSFLFM